MKKCRCPKQHLAGEHTTRQGWLCWSSTSRSSQPTASHFNAQLSTFFLLLLLGKFYGSRESTFQLRVRLLGVTFPTTSATESDPCDQETLILLIPYFVLHLHSLIHLPTSIITTTRTAHSAAAVALNNMADTASASTSTANNPTTTRKSRGANPSTDYKSLFLKSKDKYDRVSNDHTELKTNVTKATAKQQKLREELDYLLDAVASKRAQRARIEQAHRDRALELEREAAAAVAAAAAARHHASSLPSRDRDAYDHRAGGYGAEEYRPYSARYAAGDRTSEPSYPAFGSGLGRRYASPPPAAESSSQRYAPSEGSPQGAVSRDPYAAEAYRGAPSQSPPSLRRAHPHEQHSSPSKYDAHQRYRESTPPLAPSAAAVKRPRPTSVERDLLETEGAYDVDPRDHGHHVKRPRND